MTKELDSSSNPRFQLIGEVSAETRVAQLRSEVKIGLESQPLRLPPKYFYDDRGCQLFDAICDLPEYYPTRSELALLRTSIPSILSELRPTELIELGSGSSTKAEIFFGAPGCAEFLKTYIPFDISSSYIRSSADSIIAKYPFLEIKGVVGDLESDLERIPPSRCPRLFAFLGSTIGNFDTRSRITFLRGLARQMRTEDSLLLGIDLQKDRAVIERAYNDDAGVTAAFNLNILSVLNRELHANFDLSEFSHYAFYNEGDHRIEMHLISRIDQEITIPDIKTVLTLAKGDRIWTESSYKFTRQILEAELAAADLRLNSWYVSEDPHTRVGLVVASV